MVCPDIPPVSSTRPSAAQQPAAGVATRPVVAEVTVERAPPELSTPPQRVHVEGKVTASDPATQEVRIATPGGEIVVKSATPLPVGADVALDLYMQKGQLVAQIHPIRQQAATAATTAEEPQQTAPPAPAPLPPLAEGESVTGILIPKEAQQTAPSTGNTAALPPQVEETLAQLTTLSAGKLPADAPEALRQLLSTSDPLTAFSKLPPAAQQTITTYLAKPEVMAFLANILPQAADAPVDANLLQIVRAQLSARVTHDALQGPLVTGSAGQATGGMTGGANPLASALPPALQKMGAAQIGQAAQTGQQAGIIPARTDAAAMTQGTQNPAMMLVRSLLPMIENMPMPATLTGAPAGLFAQQAASAMAAQLPQNMQAISIVSILGKGAALPALQPGQMAGTIDSVTPRGFTMVSAESGFFIIKATAAAPPGSQVIFTAKPLSPDMLAMPAGILAPAAGPDAPAGFSWPALEELVQHAAAASPALAQLLRDTIPAPSSRMTPAVLFFMAALRTGVIENWLGPGALETLRQGGKKELIERLSGDFARLSGRSRTEGLGEWRVFSVPLQHDDQLTQLQFFTRQQPDPDARDNNETEGPRKPLTRFVLNIHLSRMGDMQLDGLMHAKKLDLILRSAEQLPFDARQEIMQKFASGLAQTGMQGGISFQTRRESWVTLTAADHKEFTA